MCIRRLLAIAISILSFYSVMAHAGHQDNAPIADDTSSRLLNMRKISADTPLIGAINNNLESLNVIVDDNSTNSDTGQRMLIAGKRAELKALKKQADEEILTTRNTFEANGLSGKLVDLDQFSKAVQQRFDQLDKGLAGADTDDRIARRRAIRSVKALVDTYHNDVMVRERIGNGEPVPTFEMAKPPKHRAVTPSVQIPVYLSQNRVNFNQYAYLGNDLLAAAPPISPEAQTCSYTAVDLAATPDAPQSQDILNLAAQLHYSPAEIFEYVHDNIKFEPYYGSLKGAVATLYSKAGGPTDQASLLIALLRASNIPARYVRGQVTMQDNPANANAATGGRVAQWVGAKSYLGAAQILNYGLFNPQLVSVSGTSAPYMGVTFNQVWVEACLPYGHYRGAAADNTGQRWVPLDPSYKDKLYQPGLTTNTKFDYTTYMAKRQNGPDSLPEEAFASQVEADARKTDPNATVKDVPYAGIINPLNLDIIPNSLPYDIIQFTNWPGINSPEIAQLPADHRYQWFIGGLNFTGNLTLPLPDVALKRVTLSFAGVSQSDQTAQANWLNTPTASLPCMTPIYVNPVIKLDGVAQTLPGLGASLQLCSTNNSLNMAIGLKEIATGATTLDPNNIGLVNTVNYTNIGAANWHALQAYAFQGSDTLLNQRTQKLVQSVNSISNPLDSSAHMDETEGEYLHIIGLKYMRYITDAWKKVGLLNGSSGESGNHLGLVSTQMKVQYLFDLPYAVSSSSLLVDVKGGSARSVDTTTGKLNFDAFLLSGYAGSAYESYVLQENAHADAVSAVRGIQFASEKGISVIQGVNSSNWGGTGTTCSVGSTCYKLTHNTDTTLNYTAADVSSIYSNYIAKGYTLTLPVSFIRYSSSWLGSVYIAAKNNTAVDGTASISLVINKLGGGWLATPYLSSGFFNPDNSFSFFTSTYEAPSYLVNPTITTNTAADPFAFYNSVTATNGISPYTTLAGDPVNMVTGNMYHKERDIYIKGRGGLPIVFERFYNSRNPVDGPLGFGWTHSFNHVIKLYGVENSVAKLSWIDGTGREVFFTTSAQVSGNISTGVIPNPSGIFVNFQRLANGTFQIKEKNGLTYLFASAIGPSAAPSKTNVPVIAKLLSITDRNANTLSMSYTATAGCTGGTLLCTVTDSINRNLNFTYVNNRITQLKDFAGRTYQYAYTDGQGNLNSFKNPLAVSGSQPPVNYSYYTTADGISFGHLMKQYTLPRGNGMLFEYYANGRTFRHTVVGVGGAVSPDQINTFTYNDFRRETVQTNERGGIKHFFFDPFGNPIQILEENGAETNYTYDCADVTQVAGSAGCKNPFNRLSKISPDGYITTYAYDTNGNVIKVTNPSLSTQQYVDFNAFSQPKRLQDANGNWKILRYDANGNLTDEIRTASSYIPASCATQECALPSQASQIKSWLSNGYDSAGNLTSQKHVRDFAAQISSNTPLSNTGPLLTYGFDAQKLNATTVSRIGIKNNDSSATTVNTATLTYDNLGRLLTGVDNDWYPTQFSYDDVDRVIKATDKLGNLRSFSFDPNGNLVGQQLVSAANGNVMLADSSSAIFDDSDRRVSSIDAGGFLTNYAYDAASNVTQITNPDNYSLSFEYDDANRPVYAYNQLNNAVITTRDTSGRVRTVTDPNAVVTTNNYWDSSRNGRLKTVTMPPGSFATGRQIQSDYDNNGNVITIVDIPPTSSGQSNRVSAIAYDELNRATRQVGPQYTDVKYGLVCQVILNSYDTLGRLTQVAAGYTPSPCLTPASDVTKAQATYTFDDFGRKITSADANQKSWNYSYDANNNVMAVTDAKNQATTYTWTYGHQLQSRVEQNGRTTFYTRNALGQITNIQHPSVSYDYSYDSAHRLVSVRDKRGNKTLSYDWSPGGLLNSLTDSDNGKTNYVYDPVGRLSGITTPNGDAVTLRYSPRGQLKEKFTSLGVSSRYRYYGDKTLGLLINSDEQLNLQHAYSFNYDGFANRKGVEEDSITNAGTVSTYFTYNYDQLNRLTQACKGSNATCNDSGAQQESYSYDPWNNRTGKQIGTSLTSYAYDNANQLTTVYNGTPQTGTVTASYVYDNNGNMTSDGSRNYTWDALDQLTQVTKAAVTVNYGYDSEGKRIQKVLNDGTTTTTTQYLNDGDNLYAEYGPAWAKPNALYSFTGLDHPLERTAVTAPNTYGQSQYYVQDGINSVVGSYTVNAGTYSLTAQNFDAWGNWVSGTGTGTISQFGYTGREPNETGLVYYRARYYNPAIGRFTSRDPSGLSAGINLYAYANNNPVNFNDPFGLTANSPLGIAYAAADTSYFNTSSDAQPPPYVQLGKAYAGVAAVVVGWTTNNDFLKNAGIEGLSEAQNDNVNLLLMLGTMGRGGANSVASDVEDFAIARSKIYVTPGGTSIVAPDGYTGVAAQNGKGLVLLPEGQSLGNNSNIIRYGDPTTLYPDGYFRYYNNIGQPLNPATGQSDANSMTHIPQGYQGTLKGYPGSN